MKKTIITIVFMVTLFVSCQTIPHTINDPAVLVGDSTQKMIDEYGSAETVLSGKSSSGVTGYKKYIYRGEGVEIITKDDRIISVTGLKAEAIK